MIEYEIKSENSSDHWKYFNVQNKNVLDLGCGRWDVTDINEMTPFYFYKQGATKVIGVDASEDEIRFLNENILSKDQINFIHSSIDTEIQIRSLIQEHNINALKSDIENNEWLFFNFTKEDFENISNFAVEYHNHSYKQEFLNRYENWGFKLKAHGKLWIEGLGVLFFEK
jgi:SAM-dependent methyltransferase